MMLSDSTTLSKRSVDRDEPAENAVLEAVSDVVVEHLRERAGSAGSERDPAPVLIQVDGPGKSQFLQKLGEKLDPHVANKLAAKSGSHARTRKSRKRRRPEWTAIQFDAWQYQRLSPPWWWLLSTIDKQIRAHCLARGWWPWARQRWRDVRERLMQLGRDLLWVLPGAVILSLGWELLGNTVFHQLKWLVTAAGGIAALVALLSSIRNALTRHLLAESPRGTKALLRTTDPMEDLLRRYGFLVQSAGTGLIVLIDNLDRCHADYVVEMLEGIQTLLRNLPESKRGWLRKLLERNGSKTTASETKASPRHEPRTSGPPLVVFVVAADRGWLCDSYLHVYQEFEASAREPGRPFGLAFIEKIFEFALRIPTVPAAASVQARTDRNRKGPLNPFQKCDQEIEVRETLRHEENGLGAERERSEAPPPVLVLRTYAVKQLAKIESEARRRGQRRDTTQHLDQLLAELDPGPAVQLQLKTAYCVNRTAQLLAGHAVDADDHAIYRLGLWTVLELKWPLLASHLTRHPHDLEHIAKETAPDGIDADLKLVFDDPMARRLARGVIDVKLTAEDIEQFTTPLPCLSPSASDFQVMEAAA